MRVSSMFALLMLLAGPPALAQTAPELAGEWDVTVTSSGGTAAARLALAEAAGGVAGTSGPLDANMYWPLEVSGHREGGAWQLDFRSDGEAVGSLRVSGRGGALTGEGQLYGTPVWLAARRHGAADARPGRTHRFEPSAYQLHFSSRIPPALTIAPGDTVTTNTLDNEGRDSAGAFRAMPGNPLTGPFYVEGAMPGDTLVVRLVSVRLTRGEAHMYGRQLNLRAVPSGYPQTPDPAADRSWRLDLEHGVARLARPSERLFGLTVPLRPMIGSIGVAPPGNQALSAGDIGFHGGNMDYNRIGAGTTLYFPVFQPGALLSLGDAHAAQGDGEISGQGLETSAEVTFTVDLVRGSAPRQPWAENDRWVMISGIDNSLDEALRAATASAAIWLKERYGLNDSEAATFLSASVAYDVASIVSGRPHVVARLDKAALAQLRPAPAREE